MAQNMSQEHDIHNCIQGYACKYCASTGESPHRTDFLLRDAQYPGPALGSVLTDMDRRIPPWALAGPRNHRLARQRSQIPDRAHAFPFPFRLHCCKARHI